MDASPRLEFDLCDHPSAATSRVIAYLDSELRSEYDFSMTSEYPSVFGEYPGGESIHCSWDGDIVSHVAIVSRLLIHPVYSLRVGLIGSVVTTEAFRGRGLGRSLMEQALARLRQKGCALAILWSEKDRFYAGAGFCRAGAEQTALVSPGIPFDDSAFPDMVPAGKEHVGAIWRLYMQGKFRMDRSLEEQRRLLGIPKTQVYLTEVDGKVTSYLAVNKGADFSNYVHEWGGDRDHLRSMVARLARRLPANQKLGIIGPAHEGLPVPMGSEPAVSHSLAWFRVLDPRALRAVYFRYLEASGISFRWDSFSKNLHLGSRRIRLDSPLDHAQGILGGTSENEGPTLPMFIWGWDSI